jgi:hypothetical protein
MFLVVEGVLSQKPVNKQGDSLFVTNDSIL